MNRTGRHQFLGSGITAFVLVLLASAQDTVIPSLAQNGRITFAGVSNVSQYATGYRVQWSSSAQGPWTNFQTLAALDTIPPSSDGLGLMKQQLPMYYRVVASLATNSTASVAGNGPGSLTGPTVSTNIPVSPIGSLPSSGSTTTTTTSTSSNITLGAVAAVVESDGKYNAFPGVTMLPDGRLMAVYRKGTDHYQSDDGVLYAKFSSNTGATWTGETCIYAPQNSLYGIYPDARDPEIRTLKNGTLLLSFFEYGANPVTTANTTLPRCMIGTPTANGPVSWSPPINLYTGTLSACSSKPLELSNGQIMQPIHTTYPHNHGEVGVVFSSDGGQTWGGYRPAGTNLAHSYNLFYSEANAVQYPDGEIVMMMRTDCSITNTLHGPCNGYSETHSFDNGITWSPPTTPIPRPYSCMVGTNTVASSNGRAAICLANSGALILCARGISPFYAGYTVSWDRGATWTPWMAPPGSSSGACMYASMVVLPDSSIGLVMSYATLYYDIHYQQLLDAQP